MKHCLMVKWNDKVENKKALEDEVEKLFSTLTRIDGISAVVMSRNCVQRPARYDFLIVVEMEKHVLPLYDESAEHIEWKSKYGHLVESKAIIDI